MRASRRKSAKVTKNSMPAAKASKAAELLPAHLLPETEIIIDIPSSSTPDSLTSFPPSAGIFDDVEHDGGKIRQTLERRKVVHLACEHRRRRQIADGLERLRDTTMEGLPKGSKMEVLLAGIHSIEHYEKKLQELNLAHLELTGLNH